MPRFAANISLLFTEVPFLERFAAAAEAGFEAVEFQFPYTHPPEEVAEAARRGGVDIVLHNVPPGDWERGERGLAALPGRSDDFRRAFDKAIVYARALRCPKLNCLAGCPPPDADPQVVTDVLVENLRHAAQASASEGLSLTVEALNSKDVPGFWLSTSMDVIEVLDRVVEPNIGFQFDTYHHMIMENELIDTVRRLADRIAHVQIADYPGRHEPGTGEIEFRTFFSVLDEIGYDGWVGCEYHPAAATLDGLAWFTDQQEQGEDT